MKKTFIISIILSICFFGCKKEDSDNNQNVIEKYYLDSVETDTSIDWNLDGIYSDLFSEVPNLKNSVIIINNHSKSINIIWYEPKINENPIGYLPTSPLPPSLSINFFPVQNIFYFKRLEKEIQPYQSVENNNYTFIFPKKIFQDGDEIIFMTTLNIFTINGTKTITIKCIYKKK